MNERFHAVAHTRPRRPRRRVLRRRPPGRTGRPHPDERRVVTMAAVAAPGRSPGRGRRARSSSSERPQRPCGARAGATRVVDLGGRMVLPAFQDSHIHLVTGGVELGLCDLNGLADEGGGLRQGPRLRRGPSRTPPWITGGGWDLPLFPQADPAQGGPRRRRPRPARRAETRPTAIPPGSTRGPWRLAGVTADTPDPAGGRIERDPKTGEPTGTLRESAAGLVERLVPELGPEDYIKGLKAGLALANRCGIASIIEASAGPTILDAYAALDRAGELTVRVLASLHVDTRQGRLRGRAARRAAPALRGRGGSRSTAAKIFADGVMEPHTAALLEPYVDRPGDRGTPLLEPEAFDALAVALDRAGFQIHVHAIGDRAIRMSLDAFEAAGRANGFRDMRHHIAHLELIDPADIPRFKAARRRGQFPGPLGLRRHLHHRPDPAHPRPRPARAGSIPIGSVAGTGAVIAGGSDWSVSSMNPLEAIQVALTRRGPDDPPGEAWIPEETGRPRDHAPGLHRERRLAQPRREDARLPREPARRPTSSSSTGTSSTIPPSEIGRAKVLLTLLDGREVFRDPSFGI